MKQHNLRYKSVNYKRSCHPFLKVAAAAAALIVSFGTEAAETIRPSFLTSGKSLTVCNSPGFPPLSYFEQPGDEAPVGADIELLGALAKEWNVELRLMLGEFAGLLPALESGRCDLVMSGILVTPERQQKFDAVPYMKTSTLLLVASNNETVRNLEDMSGKTLAIEAGTILEKAASDANAQLIAAGKPEIHLQTYPKAQDCIEQVLIGRSDATLVQDTEAAFRDKQMPGRLKAVFTLPDSRDFGIYLRKSSGDADAVKAALDRLKASGFMDELPMKWHLPKDATNFTP